MAQSHYTLQRLTPCIRVLKKVTVSHLCKKTPRLVHYRRAHKSPPLDPILRQMNTHHILTPYFFKINFFIILPPTGRSSDWFLPLRIPNKIKYAFIQKSVLKDQPIVPLLNLITLISVKLSTSYTTAGITEVQTLFCMKALRFKIYWKTVT
jgi:hypothetical protein